MRSILVSLAAVGALVLAPSAAAEPFAFASAHKGNLSVTSGVNVLERSVELRGVWLNESVPCTNFRTLRVAVEIFYTAGPVMRRIARSRTGAVMNCAEGGPNFGFHLRADGHSLACPDGTWKPGIYGFVTRTTQLASGLRATASLNIEVTDPC